MGKSLRLSEKWFRRGLWAVALAFAWFLSGLGSVIVGDLPRVEQRLQLDDHLDAAAAQALRGEIQSARKATDEARQAMEQAQLQHRQAVADSQSAQSTFQNWLATRRATARPEQDTDLIARTRDLDALKAAEREALAQVQVRQKEVLDLQQAAGRAQARLGEMEQAGRERLEQARRSQELRVFLYRLALTLPLLAVAGWLFAKKRQSTWWPFVWGFILFALVTFFVELVPYLPSYGGYVRYAVGIVVTVLVGRYAIVALNRYLERQKQAEQQPDVARRRELDYDLVLTRLAKGVCPGCERPVDLKDPHTDFCSHCGMGLFNRCGHCSTRKSAFARYCGSCGTSGATAEPEAGR